MQWPLSFPGSAPSGVPSSRHGSRTGRTLRIFLFLLFCMCLCFFWVFWFILGFLRFLRKNDFFFQKQCFSTRSITCDSTRSTHVLPKKEKAQLCFCKRKKHRCASARRSTVCASRAPLKKRETQPVLPREAQWCFPER